MCIHPRGVHGHQRIKALAHLDALPARTHHGEGHKAVGDDKAEGVEYGAEQQELSDEEIDPLRSHDSSNSALRYRACKFPYMHRMGVMG